MTGSGGTVVLSIQGSGKVLTGSSAGSISFSISPSQTFAATTITGGTVTPSQRYNFYGQGTAPNYLAGRLYLNTFNTYYNVDNRLDLVSNTTMVTPSSAVVGGYNLLSTVKTGTYASAVGYGSSIHTEASVTLSELDHFLVWQGTLTSAPTLQSGFQVAANMTGGTSNYGFFGLIPAGTNRWNLYMGGTAQNYFAGNVGIGSITPISPLEVRSTSVAGKTAPITLTNLSASSGTEVALRFAPTDSPTVRYAEISVFQEPVNNDFTMKLATSSGGTLVTFLTANHAGTTWIGTAALAQNASTGFFWIPSVNTGGPTNNMTAPYTDAVALSFSNATKMMYAYNNGYWYTMASLLGSGQTAVAAQDYGWNDLLGEIIVRDSNAADASWSAIPNLTNIYAYQLLGTGTQGKQFWLSFHIPHDFRKGDPTQAGWGVYLHIHFVIGNTGTAGNVHFLIDYTIAKGHAQSAFAAPTTSYTITQAIAAGDPSNRHYIAEGAEILSAELEPDAIMLVRVRREPSDVTDPLDTYGADIWAIKADLHYRTDRVATKNRSPNFYT